jgi:hypothetical protein
MNPPGVIRSLIPLVLGLVIGGLGATLFLQSMPGAEGSAEERAAKLEAELKRSHNRIAALEADPRTRLEKPGRGFADRSRQLAEDIREGRPVSPEDVFRAFQPLMRDLSPLFDRMRIAREKEDIEAKTGEWTRRYDLSPAQRDSLRKWFEAQSEENARRWNDLVQQDGTRLQDLMKFAATRRPHDGIDSFMERVLSGEKLQRFQSERMAERAASVQQHADTGTQRLDGIVKLDDAQRDQVFGIMARGSRDYDPAMKLEGTTGGEIPIADGATRQQALLSILRPEQRQAYEAEQQRRRESAQKDMEAIGLALPPDWDPLEWDEFR